MTLKKATFCLDSYYISKETGFYYLQSRYYDPALGRFINADSYASTGQGFLGYNMFAYCENNPVIGEDTDGNRYERATEWTDGGTNEEIEKAPCVRVAVVLYYTKPGGDFIQQARYSFPYGSSYTNVIMKPFCTLEEFIDAWSSLPKTNDLFVYCHGGEDGLHIYGEVLSDMSNISTSNISDNIYLFSCEGYSVAKNLAEVNNCNVVACKDNVSYTQLNGLSYPFAGKRSKNLVHGRKHSWYCVSPNGNSVQLAGNCLVGIIE